MRIFLWVVIALTVALHPAFPQGPAVGGPLPLPLPLFPPDNWWNADVSAAPVDPNSAALISFIGPTRGMHPDFGGDGYGFPYVTVPATQPFVSVVFDYDDESDHAGYPIPEEAKNPAFAAIHAGDFEVVQLGWQPSAHRRIRAVRH